MDDNNFFKPTALYKEFMILDLIEKDAHITQRQMSSNLGVAVSMINNYLDEYEKNGYIKRKYKSTKSVEYFISKKGLERRKFLNVGYFNSTQVLYNSAKENINLFLKQIIDKGFKNILLYGAGEVAEIMLQVINDDKKKSLKVLAVIDDDQNKVGSKIVTTQIINKEFINQYEHDGILLSSYTHHESIRKKLSDLKYPSNKIIEFFE